MLTVNRRFDVRVEVGRAEGVEEELIAYREPAVHDAVVFALPVGNIPITTVLVAPACGFGI